MQRVIPTFRIVLFVLAAAVSSPGLAQSKSGGGAAPLRGSLVEDRAARKLIEAGDARYEAEELKKAVEIWQSVIERYPRSRLRFEAHMRLGNFFLDRDRAYDKARLQFHEATSEENRNDQQRAEAMLKMGICFYEARNFGKCFQVMRNVIKLYPLSRQVNLAYYYIGLGHFQLGHYSRAIAALEKVGTALPKEEGKVQKVEAGKRLFVKIEDADLAAMEPGQSLEVLCETTGGDREIVHCFPLGRNVRVVLGTIPTRLGKPFTNNGTLEVRGDDKVKVTYTDQHTADKNFDRPVIADIPVVGDGVVAITDGAFRETLSGVVLGKTVNLQITDADRDLSDQPDRLKAVVEVHRRKSTAELEAEAVEQALKNPGQPAGGNGGSPNDSADSDELQIERYKRIDRVEVTLTEVPLERSAATISVGRDDPAADTKASAPTKQAADTKTESDTAAADARQPRDDSLHTGVFRAVVSLVKSESVQPADLILQALPGDIVRVLYLDERNTGDAANEVRTEARCVEGNLGGVRVTLAVISNQELRIQTRLKTAGALTNIGNRYKEFGLKKNAKDKYSQALAVCEEIMRDAQRLGGGLLEQTYVQLWKIYYEMDQLNLAAAMCQRLQREFPNSGFVDDALLQLADVARKQGNLQRAIGIYNRMVNMQTSQLRGEAQFGVASCYESLADAADGPRGTQLRDRAFQEFKKVYDTFPDSGRVGEAVAKMANYYYQQKDYARAIDTFESVLSEHPDARFLDVILFNYGRCLYRMGRKADARRKFDQLIADFPESLLAQDARKISDALAKAGI